ncbi:hypothetical protein [Agromyces silvae]|uniref:hypothetical protein n=1 Tax=Agromyces silvae TaxID=3388266 RepID=UPI00280C0470|nr:hypothetical protein [Agromyces protaetiae]
MTDDTAPDASGSAATGSVDAMHEASDAEVPAEVTAHEAVDPAGIEALPLVERAPRYQAVADRLRGELEQSDPSRGDA